MPGASRADTARRVAPETEVLPVSELAFRFKSDRLCLEFCATLGERWRRNLERLRTPEDLVRWVREAGLVAAAPIPSEDILVAARELREAIYRAVRAGMAGQPAETGDRDAINTWARQPSLVPQLDPEGKRCLWSPGDEVAACLATVACDAVDLLSSPLLGRVRECAAPDCAILFLDRSRPGQRRWCADWACGTKARTADYRRRKAAERPGVT